MLTTITFTVDDELMEAAREFARAHGTTLEELALKWLIEYAEGADRPDMPAGTEQRDEHYQRGISDDRGTEQ